MCKIETCTSALCIDINLDSKEHWSDIYRFKYLEEE